MPQVPVKQILEEYPFLDDRVAQEPYIYDILCEIERAQRDGYEKGAGGFATKDSIVNSRFIHIPFSPTREKNIDYILELLSTKYSHSVQTIVTFNFTFDEAAKKLALYETEEYALNIPITEYDALVADRDENSLENFNKFIQTFRLFNLDKVVKRARYKTDINRVIQKGLGRTFFTYNHYYIEKTRIEGVEEYCFHASNYEPVKRTLNMSQFKAIVTTYGELVKSRLRKFGIMSAEFNDYRDTKIDYIISILLDDLNTTLVDKDRVEVKNFKSLRECILQVDKVLDPAQILNSDIVKYIRQNGIVSAGEISSNVLNVSVEILTSWDKPDRLIREHIIRQNDISGNAHYVDALNLIPFFTAAITSFRSIDSSTPLQQKDFTQMRVDILHRAAKQALHLSSVKALLGGNDLDVSKLSHLVEEYEAMIKKATLQSEIARTAPPAPKKGRPIYLRILSFLSSIFSVFSRNPDIESDFLDDETPSAEPSPRREPRRETKEVYEKANARKGPIVALSDLIEINHENDMLIARIIQELRENNMKIVVPVYNARTILYPKRSKKLLMSDVEYLLVPPHIIKSLDLIADYVNSLVGYKLKEEVIPGRGLVMLEKYLRVLYRQRRLSQIRKREQREKTMKR